MKPIFVVIEGMDGSGTTTQVDLLHQWLDHQKIRVVKTREPTTGPVGKLIRTALRNQIEDENKHRVNMPPESLALLFAADRVDHCKRFILPNLEHGINVISDRYVLSSMIYQSIDLNRQKIRFERDPFSWLKQINSRAIQETITIVLTVPVQMALSRLSNRSVKEIFETETFLKEIAPAYHQAHLLLPGHNIRYVNGDQEKHMVFADILKVLKEDTRLPF